MTTPKDLIDAAIERLESGGIANARRNAEWMLCDILECSSASLYARLEEVVADQEIRRFKVMVERRLKHEPLQYILGQTEFFGLRLRVTRDVLIPRPETEQVVEHALALIRPIPAPHVLDVGTGCGCIALAVKSQREDASVTACDVSSAALQVARDNASSTELTLNLIQGDALSSDFAEVVPGRLDLIVSNPPYVSEAELESLPRDVREHEPHLALIAPDDPLVFYRKLSGDGRRLLKPGGWIVLETHADFGRDAEAVLKAEGYEHVDLLRDYAGRSRILSGRAPG